MWCAASVGSINQFIARWQRESLTQRNCKGEKKDKGKKIMTTNGEPENSRKTLEFWIATPVRHPPSLLQSERDLKIASKHLHRRIRLKFQMNRDAEVSEEIWTVLWVERSHIFQYKIMYNTLCAFYSKMHWLHVKQGMETGRSAFCTLYISSVKWKQKPISQVNVFCALVNWILSEVCSQDEVGF